MEGLLEKQIALASLIDRFTENTLKAGRANFNAGFLRSRRELLEKYWGDFQHNHQMLLSDHDLQDQDYVLNDRYSSVEIHYSCALGMLYDEEARVAGPPRAQAEDAALTGLPHRQVHLLKIALPTFSGLQQDWETFRDMFRSLVHIDPSLTGVQKLHYLKSCMGGPSIDILASLEITEANYSVAWDLLRARYDNRQLLVHQHLTALTSITTLKAESGAGLLHLHDVITRRREALRMLEQPVESWDQWFVFFAAKGMDASTRREWEKELSKPAGAATFEKLTTFLRQAAQTLTTIELSGTCNDLNKTSRRPENLRHPDAQKATATAQSHKVFATTTGNVDCPVCKGQHRVSRCDKFASLTPVERMDIVRRARLCHNCLAPGHLANECTSRFSCRQCNQRHHSLLHGQSFGKRKSTSETSHDSASKRSRVSTHETEAPPPMATGPSN